MNSKRLLLYSLINVSIILSGCGSRAAFNQRHFVLDASRNGPKLQAKKDIILEVQSFSIDRTFNAKGLVYRKGTSEYEIDFYNQFLVNPQDMIAEQTRKWLSQSGLFKWVLEPGTYANATHKLEGNILSLYGDFRQESSPKARMEIRFFVIKLADKSIVFSKAYEAESNIESQTGEGVVAAFDKCLGTILADLEKDLEADLSS